MTNCPYGLVPGRAGREYYCNMDPDDETECPFLDDERKVRVTVYQRKGGRIRSEWVRDTAPVCNMNSILKDEPFTLATIVCNHQGLLKPEEDPEE